MLNRLCLIDKRCFWGLNIFSIQNRLTISGFVPLSRQLIVYRLLGYLSIHPHQFEYRQKEKTNEAYQPSLFVWSDEKGDLYFLGQWEFFQHDFHQNNLIKNTFRSSRTFFLKYLFRSSCKFLKNHKIFSVAATHFLKHKNIFWKQLHKFSF